MGMSEKIKDGTEGAEIIVSLLPAIQENWPIVACLVVAVVFVCCFLPNGVIASLIAHRTEMRKLEERVNQSRKKLNSGRQNRKK